MARKRSSAARAASGGSPTYSQQTELYQEGALLHATRAVVNAAERASSWKAAAKVYRDRARAAVARQLQLRYELEELRRLLDAERALRLAEYAATAADQSQCSASAEGPGHSASITND